MLKLRYEVYGGLRQHRRITLAGRSNLTEAALQPVRAKKTPATLYSKVKHMFEKWKYSLKKLPLRRSQKWVEAQKYVLAILEEILA